LHERINFFEIDSCLSGFALLKLREREARLVSLQIFASKNFPVEATIIFVLSWREDGKRFALSVFSPQTPTIMSPRRIRQPAETERSV
jgi:hypothetical protein